MISYSSNNSIIFSLLLSKILLSVLTVFTNIPFWTHAQREGRVKTGIFVRLSVCQWTAFLEIYTLDIFLHVTRN